MTTHITWNRTTPAISKRRDFQTRDNRRSEARVAPPWHVEIDIEDGLHISTPLADLSVRTFRIELLEMFDLGTEVQFSIFENTNEYSDGKALKGEATVSSRHRGGTVFEFQEFKGNDFNRLCDALLEIIMDPAHQSE